MTNQDLNGVQINRTHNDAIRKEIGERLRVTLTGNANQLPPDILSLTERFDSVERSDLLPVSSAVA